MVRGGGERRWRAVVIRHGQYQKLPSASLACIPNHVTRSNVPNSLLNLFENTSTCNYKTQVFYYHSETTS